jgi:hypothetical protein
LVSPLSAFASWWLSFSPRRHEDAKKAKKIFFAESANPQPTFTGEINERFNKAEISIKGLFGNI